MGAEEGREGAPSRGAGIRDVARELGMSISTVSRAMNGRGEVSAETRRLVSETAAALGYRPNQSGRSLRQGRTNMVALVMPTQTARTQSGETFFLNVCNGLQEVLWPRGLDLVVLPFGSAAKPDEFLRNAVDRHLADAFVLADTRRTDPRVDYLVEQRVPFVSLGRTRAHEHSWLDLDFAGVAAQSVRRLAAAGHRRIAVATADRDVNSDVEFLRGYAEAVAEHGLDDDPELVLRLPDTRDAGGVLTERLLAPADRPTAVVLAQETLAPGLYRHLRANGVEPGRDLAVIGFRENPVCEHLTPSLTCFHVSLEHYGRRLGELVLDRLAPVPPPPVGELWPMTLVPKDSDRPC
jgi:DNA-binding LacI/PurR family transcriptional regulator